MIDKTASNAHINSITAIIIGKTGKAQKKTRIPDKACGQNE